MKKLFLLICFIGLFLSSEARPDATKWIKCLYDAGHDCSAGGPPVSPCQVVRGETLVILITIHQVLMGLL